MAIVTIAISNHPLSGLKRSLDVVGLNIGTSAVTLNQVIYYLDSNNNRINTTSIASYEIDSSATNISFVDPATGLYVIPNGSGEYIYEGGTQNGNTFTGTPVGEYDFLISLLNTAVNINNMITQYVQLNDSLGDYN